MNRYNSLTSRHYQTCETLFQFYFFIFMLLVGKWGDGSPDGKQ